MSHRVDYEAEMGIVMKKKPATSRRKTLWIIYWAIPVSTMFPARDLQKPDGQWDA